MRIKKLNFVTKHSRNDDDESNYGEKVKIKFTGFRNVIRKLYELVMARY